MQTHWIDENLTYDGSQLTAHWILRRTGIADDAMVGWRGPCRVPIEQMADLEDLLAGDSIAGDDMLHFVIERFDRGIGGIDETIVRQRLLSAQAFELLVADPGLSAAQRDAMTRKGDDLWVGDAKLSISIATVSPVSSLLHFALDVTSAGTPVPTIGLLDLGVDPRAFADRLFARVRDEERSMRGARVKVRARPEAGGAS
jgi:hypothetical protein